MKIKNKSDDSFKLILTHKELKVIERALNFMDSHSDEDLAMINSELFDKDEFICSKQYEKFETKMWLKIMKKLEKVDVY